MKKFSMMMVGAAALAMSFTHGASASVDISNLNLTLPDDGFHTTLGSQALFFSALASDVAASGTGNSLVALASYYGDLKSAFETFPYASDGTLYGSVTAYPSNLVSGDAPIWTAQLSFVDSSKTVAFDGQTITFNGTASVPGPVAGAGLPVALLALGGFAFWRNRRAVA